MKKRWYFLLMTIILIGIMGGGMVSCSKPQQDVKILLTLREGLPYNTFFWNSATLALEEWNASHPGSKIKAQLVRYDYNGNSQTLLEDYQQVIENEKPIAVIGSFFSKDVVKLIPAIAESEIPYLTQGTATQLTEKGAWSLFRIQASDSNMCTVSIKYIAEVMEIKKVAVIYSNTVFGNGARADLEKAAKRYGVELVRELSYEVQANESIQNQIEEINQTDAEICILWPDFGEYAMVLASLEKTPLKMPFFGNQGFQPISDGGIDLKPFEGNYVMNQFMYLKYHEEWEAAMKSRFGLSPKSEEYPAVYDMTMNILSLLEAQEGTVTPKGLSDSLRQNPYSGICGLYAFDEKGEGVRQAYIGQIHNGKVEFLKIEVIDH